MTDLEREELQQALRAGIDARAAWQEERTRVLELELGLNVLMMERRLVRFGWRPEISEAAARDGQVYLQVDGGDPVYGTTGGEALRAWYAGWVRRRDCLPAGGQE